MRLFGYRQAVGTRAHGVSVLSFSFSRFLIRELHVGKLSETVIVHGNAPHARPRFLVSHLIGNRDVLDPFLGVNFNNGNSNGVFIGGGQVGYNWQVGYAVLGIEADFDGAANNNNTRTVGIVQVTSNNRWITTLAARFGVTNGPWLFYGKAGAGWVGNEDFTITNLTTGTSITASNNNTNSGWLVGAGIEWAFAPNWSAKVEYNYL